MLIDAAAQRAAVRAGGVRCKGVAEGTPTRGGSASSSKGGSGCSTTAKARRVRSGGQNPASRAWCMGRARRRVKYNIRRVGVAMFTRPTFFDPPL